MYHRKKKTHDNKFLQHYDNGHKCSPLEFLSKATSPIMASKNVRVTKESYELCAEEKGSKPVTSFLHNENSNTKVSDHARLHS